MLTVHLFLLAWVLFGAAGGGLLVWLRMRTKIEATRKAAFAIGLVAGACGEIMAVPLVKEHVLRTDDITVVKRKGERGSAFLLEMLVALAILMVILAAAIPNAIQILRDRQQMEAQQQVLLVFRAQSTIVICYNTPGCTPSPGLVALIPAPGNLTMNNYTYTFVYVGDGNWSYQATPHVSGTGETTYFINQTGVLYCNGVACP